MGKNVKKLLSMLLVSAMVFCGSISTVSAMELKSTDEEVVELASDETATASEAVSADVSDYTDLTVEMTDNPSFKIAVRDYFGGYTIVYFACYDNLVKYVNERYSGSGFNEITIEVLNNIKDHYLSIEGQKSEYRDGVMYIRELPMIGDYLSYQFCAGSSGVELRFDRLYIDKDEWQEKYRHNTIVVEPDPSLELGCTIQYCYGNDFALKWGNTRIRGNGIYGACRDLELYPSATVYVEDDQVFTGKIQVHSDEHSATPKLVLNGPDSFIYCRAIEMQDGDENLKFNIIDNAERRNGQNVMLVNLVEGDYSSSINYRNTVNENYITRYENTACDYSMIFEDGTSPYIASYLKVYKPGEVKLHATYKNLLSMEQYVGKNIILPKEGILFGYDDKNPEDEYNMLLEFLDVSKIESSDEDIISVEETLDEYIIEPKKSGTATISIYSTSFGGSERNLDLDINVFAPLSSVEFVEAEDSINRGATTTIRAKVAPSEGIKGIDWIVTDEKGHYLSDKSGIKVSALATPEAIDADTEFSANVEVASTTTYSKVKIVAGGINAASASKLVGITKYRLSDKELSLFAGSNGEISVLDPAGKKVTAKSWSSDNENVATVLAGKISALSEGTANITAVYSDGGSGSCQVTVVDKVTAVVNQRNTKLYDKVDGKTSDAVTVSFAPVDKYNELLSEYSAYYKCEVSDGADYVSLSDDSVQDGLRKYTVSIKPEAEITSKIPVTIHIEYPTLDINGDVTAGTIEYKYEVLPYDDTEFPENFKAYALVDKMTSLGAIQDQLDLIPTKSSNKWTFVDPLATKLTPVSGQKYKYYKVKYENLSGDIIYADLPVYMTKISGIDTSSIPLLMTVGDINILPLTDMAITTIGCSVNDITVAIHSQLPYTSVSGVNTEFSCVVDKETVIENEGNRITAKSAGTAKVTPTATISLKSGLETVYESKLTGRAVSIKVLDKKANIQTKIQTKNDSDEWEDYYDNTLVVGKEYRLIDETLDFANKVTSSDTKVLKITANKTNKTEYYIVPLAYGKASITVQSNDPAKSTIETKYNVVDFNILTLGKTLYTFDTAYKKPYDLGRIVAGFDVSGKAEDSVVIYKDAECSEEDSRFECAISGSDIEIKVVDSIDSSVKSISAYAKITLTNPLDLEGDNTEVSKVVPVKFNIVKKLPKVTVKEVTKPSKLTGLTGVVRVTYPAGTVIEGCTIESEEATINKIRQEAVSQTTTDIYYSLDGASDKYSAKVTVLIDGYVPVVSTIKLASDSRKFAASPATGTLYSAKDSLPINLYDPVLKRNINDSLTSCTVSGERRDKTKYADIYEVKAVDGNLVLKLKEGKTIDDAKDGDKLTLNFSDESFNYSPAVNYTVKVLNINKAKLVLSSSTLNVYKYPDSSVNNHAKYVSELSLTGGSNHSLLNNIVITENAKNVGYPNLGRSINVVRSGNKLEVTLNSIKDVTAGKTYDFAVTIPADEEAGLIKPITSTLKVKVVEVKDMSTCMTLTQKGNVDVFARSKSGVTVTPKFLKVPGTVYAESVELAGRDANLFTILDKSSFATTGSFMISAKENVNLTVGASYQVYPVVTVKVDSTSEDRISLTIKSSKAITIKPVQGKVLLGAGLPAELSVGSLGDRIVKLKMVATNEYGESIAFTSGKVASPKTGVIGLMLTPNVDGSSTDISFEVADSIQKGKTITVKFELTPSGNITNGKPITFTQKVLVK